MLLLVRCWAEAAGEAGATGRPEGRFSSAGARGAGPRTEKEAAPSLSGARPSADPEGLRPDVFGPDAPPGEAPRVPGCPLGVPSASRDSPAQAAWHPGAGACAWRGHLPRPPAGRGRGCPPSSASPVRPPPSLSPVRPPRSAAGRELPGDRGSGCCLPVRPLACRPPLLSLLLGPWPAVYMPVKPLATPSPSEPQLPEGEASRPANWTGRSDLGPPDSDPRPLCRLRHHLGGIGLWCFEEGVWCRERNPGDFWLSPFFGLRGFRLRELAHGFLDEKEEIQIPNHFHPGGVDGCPLCERGPLLQSATAGWRGFCQLIVKVGAGTVSSAGEEG